MPDDARILTANLCIAPSGLQNRILPRLCILGGWIFGIPLFVGLTLGTYILTRDAVMTAKCAISMYAPVATLVGFILGVQGGRILGGISTRLLGSQHDCKKERLEAFARSVFPGYDIILIQELYTAWPYFLDADYVRHLVTLAKEQGFVNVAYPAPRCWPSIAMGTGLLVLTRSGFSIQDSSTISFTNQFIGETFGVNRGGMHARVKLPRSSQHVDVFTCHMSPSMREVLLPGFPEFFLRLADKSRLGQLNEWADFIESHRAPGNWCVVAGDFNANIVHRVGSVQAGPAMDFVNACMVKRLKLKFLGAKVSYGYVPAERLLTNCNQKEGFEGTEDLAFIDNTVSEVISFSNVSFAVAKESRTGHGGYTHLSDHLGLAIHLAGFKAEPTQKIE
jgi:endonuclease/exonuclease/phosphatase family metal-dependent hydrolase